MKRAGFETFTIAIAALAIAGCATSFSAPGVRAEIARQTGAEPKEAFEVYAGPVTMALVRHVVGDPGARGSSLLGSRVTSFEIAVYEFAPKGAQAAPPLDFTLMPVRGWEPTLRYRSERGTGMVLIRTSGDTVADLVVLSSDADGAVYGRLRGTLSKELPAALGKVIQSGGPDAIQRELETVPDVK